MSNFKIVFKNTLFLTISEACLKIIGFAWIIYLAHALGVSLFGRYSFVNSFIALFAFLPDLGIGLITVREIAKHREKAQQYVSASFTLTIFLACLTVFVVLFTMLIFKFPFDTQILIGIAVTTLLVSTFRAASIFFLEGTEQMQFSALLNVIHTFLLIGFGFAGIVLGFGLIGVFGGMFVGSLIGVLIAWIVVARKKIYPLYSRNFDLMKRLFFQGLPLGIASISAIVYTRIDSVILHTMLGERAVGIYNSATPFVFSLIQLLNVPFMVAVYPALSRLSLLEDNHRFKKAIQKSFFIIVFWSIPATLTIFFFSEQIIPLLFGSRYKEASVVLKILIFFVPFASLSALFYKVLIILKKQYMYLLISSLGVCVNVLANILLIPKFGLIGASVASVATQAFLFFVYLLTLFIVSKK